MNGPDFDDAEGLPPTVAARIDAACDRFEAAWCAGGRPRVEDYLADVPDAVHPHLLRELLKVELAYRRKRGERPAAREYCARFPRHDGLIAEVFGAGGNSAGAEAALPRGAGPGRDADRNLLFGVLALQLDFISREALIAAVSAWVLDKARPLDRILVDQGALAEARRDLLEALVKEHLDQHGGDPERSLAALSSLGTVRCVLEAVADADLQVSLSAVATERGEPEDPDATRAHAAGGPTSGGPTSAGARFRILRPHAKGGLGEVFVARDEELNREVALKEIQPRYANHPESRARFLLEAEITGRLEHPGIVPVYGLGTHADGRPYYAMRFVRGDSLREAIARFHAMEGPGRDPGERALALRRLLGRFIDVCNAVAYAHDRGVLHRDLKPGNILLGPYGETLVVDWGLAKVVGRPDAAARADEGTDAAARADEGTLRPEGAGSGSETLPGSHLGTPAYMSPEQAAGELDRMGPASDVYSLGATLYCILTGRPPFERGELGLVLKRVRIGGFLAPRHVDWTISAALEAVCLKAMELRPEGRYSSPRDLAEDLEHWLADEPVSARPEGWDVRLTRWAWRHRTRFLAAGAALLTAMIVLILVAWPKQPRPFAMAVAFSPDGATLATSSARGTIDLRESGTGQTIRTLDGHRGGVHRVAFSPDGAQLASGGSDGTVRLWDLASGRELLVRSPRHGFTSIGERLARPPRHARAVIDLAFSPDGKRLAGASVAFREPPRKGGRGTTEWKVTIWEAATGREVRTWYTGSERGENINVLYRVAFSPDGKRLASMEYGMVHLWDVATAQFHWDWRWERNSN